MPLVLFDPNSGWSFNSNFSFPHWLNIWPTSGHSTCPPLLTGVECQTNPILCLFFIFTPKTLCEHKQLLPSPSTSLVIREPLFAVSPRVEFLPGWAQQAQTWLGVELILNAWKRARNKVTYIYSYTCMQCASSKRAAPLENIKNPVVLNYPSPLRLLHISSFINVIFLHKV